MEGNLQRPQFGTTSISSRGRIHKMSSTMQQSVSEWDFFGHSYYVSSSSHFCKRSSPNVDDGGARHETELQLLDKMCNPIAIHAKMMDDIMYFHQTLKSSFLQAVVKEVSLWTVNNGNS